MLGDDHWTAHPEKGTTSHGTINGTSARDDRRHSVIGLAVRSEPAGSTTNRVHPGRIDRGRRLSHGRDAAQPPRLHGNGRFRGRQKKSSRSSPTSSWSCVCLPVCSDWQPCSRHSSALLDQPIHDQGSEPYDLPYDSGPCLVLSDTILRQRTHRS